MKTSSKYLISLVIAFITGFLAEGLIVTFSKSPDGTNTDFGFIEVGITFIIGLIIGCTALIIFTIKENKNS